VTASTVDVAPVRRWVRKRQAAHRDRGSTLGSIYFGLLLAATFTGIFWPTVRAAFWPVAQSASLLTAGSVALLALGGLQLGARRLGPLALSRPATSWLLTAPVNRRALLLPSLALAAALAAAVGAGTGASLAGHVLSRPVTAGPIVTAALLGALLGVAAMLVAYRGQTGLRRADDLAYPLIGLGLAGLLAGTARPAGTVAPGVLTAPATLAVAGVLTLVVATFTTAAVRRLPRTPNERLLEASRTTGTLFDAAYANESSFFTEMVERRYWAGRRLRSRPLSTRLPVPAAQDLRLALRRPRRLIWLAAAASLPLLASRGPVWQLPVVVLAGLMAAAATTTASVRTDAGNPVLLRLLARNSRDVIGQRMWVPGVLATAWAGSALLLLGLLGDLPAGPWWALGLVLGPIGAVAAVRRARLGFVRNDLLPLETPMGTVATGPVLAAAGGFDALVLAIPAVVTLVDGTPLTWTEVATQAVFSVAGALIYVRYTSSEDRTDLA
jgi:hypothetical protein